MNQSELAARVAEQHRKWQAMDLEEFIADAESRYFRTPFDTGANFNAMFVWNVLRAHAGLPRLTEDDLIHKYFVVERGMTLEEGREEVRRIEELHRSR